MWPIKYVMQWNTCWKQLFFYLIIHNYLAFSACVFPSICCSSDFLAETTATHPDLHLNRFEISPHSPTNLTSRALGSLLQFEAGGKTSLKRFYLAPRDRILINILFSTRTLCKTVKVSAWFWPCLWHWRNIFETNKIFIRVLCYVIASFQPPSQNQQPIHPTTGRTVPL